MSEIVERLRPDCWGKFAGNPLAVNRVRGWCKGGRRELLVISGASGVGKTTLAFLALGGARTPYLLDPSATPDVDIKALVTQGGSRRPLDGSLPIGLIVDDIDGGGVKVSEVLAACQQSLRCPIIVTCRDATSSASLRKLVTVAAVHAVLAPASQKDTQVVLVSMCRVMQVRLHHAQVVHIHRTSAGDLRQAIVLGEFEAIGGCGAPVVTDGSSARLPKGSDADVVAVGHLLGLHTGKASVREGGDPFRAAVVAHDLGLELAGATGSLEAWSTIMDGLAVADVLERTGGHKSAHHIVARAIASNPPWVAPPPRLTARLVGRVPAIFKMMGTAARTRRVHGALRRVFATAVWDHSDPLSKMLKAAPHRLSGLARDYELHSHEIETLGKWINVDKSAIAKAAAAASSQTAPKLKRVRRD